MAVDKLVDSTQLNTDLTSVANAIRAKSGGSYQLAFPSGFVSEIGNIPSGGSGLTTIASGTFTGNDSNIISALSIGKKMAQTDFYFKAKLHSGTEIPYDAYYKFADIFAVVFSDICHYDLSTNGNQKNVISDLSYDINNSGTITNSAVGDKISVATNIRNTSVSKNANMNQFLINKSDAGYTIYLGHSNTSYKFINGATYDYEIVYFGSNPSSDIVEIP